MGPALLWKLAPVAVAAAFATLLSFAACGRQQEGERCDFLAGESGEDSDCDDGLVCNANIKTGICCRADGQITEPACQPGFFTNEGGGGGASASSTTTTGGGEGGQGGNGGAAGGADGGGGSAGGGGS